MYQNVLDLICYITIKIDNKSKIFRASLSHMKYSLNK